MNLTSTLAFAAASFSAALALAVAVRKQRSVASWSFCVGMAALACESALIGAGFREAAMNRIVFWQTSILQGKAFLPAVWLCFSVTFSRGNSREFLRKSWPLLALLLVLPIALVFWQSDHLLIVVAADEAKSHWFLNYSFAAKILNGILLVSAVLILMNLERTFRSAVGTMQWRIKFVALGVGIIFGAQIYTRSQALIYSQDSPASSAVEVGALFIGCIFLAVGYVRGGFGAIDIYPSRAALHTSLTVLLAGGYLFVIGVLAQVVARRGGSGSFQLEALLILGAIALLAVLLLSKRLRQGIQQFISRHFTRPQHDSRKIWSRFTRLTSSVLEPAVLCNAAAQQVSETFSALSVTIWLLDARQEKLILGASTSQASEKPAEAPAEAATPAEIGVGLSTMTGPFDLEKAKGEWAANLRRLSTPHFETGGGRVAVPLRAGERALGLMILADRVNAIPYTAEEMDLLRCIGDQIATSLLNLGLAHEVMRGRELEAFQTMSTFFVHDLKNAASTLTLMLQNLPVHFDDPAFRADALRGIGRTADRINQLIGSLGVVRQKLALQRVELDLNAVVDRVLEEFDGLASLAVVKDLGSLPLVYADPVHLQSVITNLLLNARDAVEEKGEVIVQTTRRGEAAVLSVADNGCGMSPVFVRDSLFRPFATTKKKGLGIGLFQSKMIVEAHGGNIQVTSDTGKGTTFRVFLPFGPGQEK
ncbi:MAG: XrtA/PEP-CTERM system histidine kinase PrsK [Chthoniobacterales bacterium]